LGLLTTITAYVDNSEPRRSTFVCYKLPPVLLVTIPPPHTEKLPLCPNDLPFSWHQDWWERCVFIQPGISGRQATLAPVWWSAFSMMQN